MGIPFMLAMAAVAAQGPPPIEWQPCPLGPDDKEQVAECAVVSMPSLHDLDHDDQTIGILVMRVLARDNDDVPRRQLWFLNGGPGDSGADALQRLVPLLDDDGLDVYTLDHRGVGGSALLACPAEQAADSPEGREVTEAEWPACISYLRDNRSDLDALTTTESAHDLGTLIAMTAAPDDRVVVFGASYGTYWANRYLQMYPEQADGVILDGIVPPDWTMAEFDADLVMAAERLLTRCAESEPCAEHLGPDPVATARALPGKFDEGHCPDLGIDSQTVRLLLGNMLMAGSDVWPYIGPMIHRLDQCRLRDLLAIGSLFERLFEQGEAGQEPESHSPVLQRHVALSEMWPDPPPDLAELEAAAQGPMTTAVSVAFAKTYAAWPRYAYDPTSHDLADYDGPMLLLHGELDPTLPPDRLADLREHYTGDRTTFVIIPDAGHVVISDSACARSLYRAFLHDPTSELDTSCVGAEPLLDLAALPEGADSLFGTDDLWGDRRSDFERVLIAAGIAALVSAVSIVRWFMRRRRHAHTAA